MEAVKLGTGPDVATSEPVATANETSSSIHRPGISPTLLKAAGVRAVSAQEAHKLCGLKEPGLWLPYHDLSGNPVMDGGLEYGRLRLQDPPPDHKYHQRAKSKVHAYIPPDFRPAPGGDLAIIEGEFKALALTEANVTAIGISGFHGARYRDEDDLKLLPEVAEGVTRARPERILYFGDSDTTLNDQFPFAALELAKLVAPLPLLLPRIPLDQPKGIDDCREAMADDFPAFLEDIISGAIEVETEMTSADLAMDLLERERELLIRGEFGMSKRKARERLIKIGAVLWKTALTIKPFVALAAKALGADKREIQSAIKAAAKAEVSKERKVNIPITDFVFDGKRYFHFRDGQYETMAREDTLLHLDAMGASRVRDAGEMSPAESWLLTIQNERRADYAGPICGRPAGLFEESGHRILATTSPRIIEATNPEPRPGPLGQFFAGLFGEGQDPLADLQLGLFIGWLKQFRRALTDPSIHLPGHLLGLIGPRDCGKSLGQDMISLLAGGRYSDASSWLQGKSDFNSQLWNAEHLILSDANLEDDARIKKTFRDAIKGIVANPVYPLTRKYVDEISLRPIWRISLSANDDAQSAGVIPSPIADPSLADKVLYLKCYAPREPFHSDDPHDRLRFWNSLNSDIPNFLGFVEAFEVDKEWQKGRFGLKEWIHPDIANLIDANNPDREIMDFLEDYLQSLNSDFEGRAKDLFEALETHSGDKIRRCCRNGLILSHALKRIATLPDWTNRIEWHEARYGKNRQKGLRFTIRTGLDR